VTTDRSSRRRSARVALTVLAGAGVLLGGATAASAAGSGLLVDINGDGVYDQYQYDTDGNGYVDSWFTDTDNNGYVDEGAADLDRDGLADLWVVDRDLDGHSEAAYYDANRDGYPDTLVPGLVYDGVWGATADVPISNPEVIGGGGSSLTGIAQVDAMNAASAQRMIDNWLAPACASSYNGC
jgi:hypothetical protein